MSKSAKKNGACRKSASDLAVKASGAKEEHCYHEVAKRAVVIAALFFLLTLILNICCKR